MAKLHFIYGTVGSGKTLHLLSVLHNYTRKGASCLVLKPGIDTRFGKDSIMSRAGLSSQANILLEQDQTSIEGESFNGHAAVLLDECQFVHPELIDFLRTLSIERNIPVHCYGLKTDFLGRLFPATRRIIEVSDTIEEVKNLCLYCESKATMNLRLQHKKPTVDGPQLLLGSDETYQAVCFHHYMLKVSEA